MTNTEACFLILFGLVSGLLIGHILTEVYYYNVDAKIERMGNLYEEVKE